MPQPVHYAGHAQSDNNPAWFEVPQVGVLSIVEPMNGAFIKAVFTEFTHMTIFLFITIGTIANGCHITDVGTPFPGAPAPPADYVTVDGVFTQLPKTGLSGDPKSCTLTGTRVLSIATAFGFAIAVLVYTSAVFSGGHLNPAITIGLFVTKKISLLRMLAYVAAQMVGAILGSSFVYAIDRSGWHASKGGTNAVIPGTSDAAAWFMEFLLTGALVFVVLAATDKAREDIGAHLPILAPLAIGLTVFICHLVAIPIDGCSINPARSFGPAVIAGRWTDQWIFWVGPITGGIVGALIYEFAFRPSRQPLLPPGKYEGRADRGPFLHLPGFAGLRGAWRDSFSGTQQPATAENIIQVQREGRTDAGVTAADDDKP